MKCDAVDQDATKKQACVHEARLVTSIEFMDEFRPRGARVGQAWTLYLCEIHARIPAPTLYLDGRLDATIWSTRAPTKV